VTILEMILTATAAGIVMGFIKAYKKD